MDCIIHALTVAGVDDIGGPLLGVGAKEAGLVNLGPNRALTVEGGGCRWRFRDVDEDGTLVASGDRVLASALVVLMPLEAIGQKTLRVRATAGWTWARIKTARRT